MRKKRRTDDPHGTRLLSLPNPASSSGGAGTSTARSLLVAVVSGDVSSACVLHSPDRVCLQKVDAIRAAILRVFVTRRISFVLTEGPASIDMLKALRPCTDARNAAPSRRLLDDPFLDQPFGATERQSCQSLSRGCDRLEEDLMIDT